MANFDANQLASILVSRGGYNSTDAAAAANNAGGRAESLAMEFGLIPRPQTTPQALPGGNTTDLLATQRAEEENLFKQFETLQGGQEALPVLYQRLLNENNVPQLQQQLGGLRGEVFKVKDLLDRLDEDVTTRTTGTFTNESQRRRQIAAEGEPLRNSLGRLATGQQTAAEQLQTALGNVSTMFGLNTAEQDQELEPIKMRLAAFGDRAARELTGFTNDRQNELTLLLDKLQADRQLSQRDWEQASLLSQESREFERQKQLYTYQTDEAIRRTLATRRAGTNTTLPPLSFDED